VATIGGSSASRVLAGSLLCYLSANAWHGLGKAHSRNSPQPEIVQSARPAFIVHCVTCGTLFNWTLRVTLLKTHGLMEDDKPTLDTDPSDDDLTDYISGDEIREYQKRELIERICSSRALSHASIGEMLLKHLLERHLAGVPFITNTDLFEFVRPRCEDDSASRMVAGRLRGALETYFEGEGLGERVRVSIPRGRYGLIFSRYEPEPKDAFQGFWWPAIRPGHPYIWMAEFVHEWKPERVLPRLPPAAPDVRMQHPIMASVAVIKALDGLTQELKKRKIPFSFASPDRPFPRGDWLPKAAIPGGGAGGSMVVGCHLDALLEWVRRNRPELRLHAASPESDGVAARIEVMTTTTTFVAGRSPEDLAEVIGFVSDPDRLSSAFDRFRICRSEVPINFEFVFRRGEATEALPLNEYVVHPRFQWHQTQTSDDLA
jgi:hypothetical protein